MIRMPLSRRDQGGLPRESELSTEISARYKRFYRNRHVDVFVKEFQAEPVAVIARSTRPAASSPRRVRLLELLASPTGPAERAGRAIHVVHAGTISLWRKRRRCGGGGRADPSDHFVSYNLSETLRAGACETRFRTARRHHHARPEAEQIYVVGTSSARAPSRSRSRCGDARHRNGRRAMRDTKPTASASYANFRDDHQNGDFVNLNSIETAGDDLALQANDIVTARLRRQSLLRSSSGPSSSVAQMPVRVIP